MCVHLLKACSLLLLLLAGNLASAQAARPYTESAIEPQSFDRERWASAKEGIDYSGQPPGQEPSEQAGDNGNQRGGGERQPQQTPPDAYNSPPMSSEMATMLLKGLSFIGIAVLLAFLIRYLLGLQRAPRNEKIRRPGRSGGIDLEQIEERLHEAELQDYIRQAVEQGNYTLALRLHYLEVLKQLSGRKLILWKKDKTNRQYLNELSGHPLQQHLTELTRIFEHHWYGRHPLAADDYPALANRFRQMEQQIAESLTAHAE